MGHHRAGGGRERRGERRGEPEGLARYGWEPWHFGYVRQRWSVGAALPAAQLQAESGFEGSRRREPCKGWADVRPRSLVSAFTVELDTAPGTGQGDERLTVRFADGRRAEMRLHEYDRVYAVPGLYEEVVQHRLACASPAELTSRLVEQVTAHGGDPVGLRVLDFGAGNGVSGEALRAGGVGGPIVATDAAQAAPAAAERDRPGLYAEYVVGDLADVDVAGLVARHGLNCLAGAGALGLGHVSAVSFAAAWEAFPAGGWLALTVAEELVDEQAGDLGAYLAELRAGAHATEVLHLGRFRHRLRMSGEPIHYYALVARRGT
jgi:head-tail adaptor